MENIPAIAAYTLLFSAYIGLWFRHFPSAIAFLLGCGCLASMKTKLIFPQQFWIYAIGFTILTLIFDALLYRRYTKSKRITQQAGCSCTVRTGILSFFLQTSLLALLAIWWLSSSSKISLSPIPIMIYGLIGIIWLGISSFLTIMISGFWSGKSKGHWALCAQMAWKTTVNLIIHQISKAITLTILVLLLVYFNDTISIPYP